MKLSEHTEHIRQLIDKAFRNRLGRMGISSSSVQPIQNVAPEYLDDRMRVDTIRPILISETGSEKEAFEKLVEEFTFTLFNRIAALKVMEAHTLHPEIITKRTQHGDRSFSHLLWLERNPEGRQEDQEGLIRFFLFQLKQLAEEIPLFSPRHPYHLLPTPVELNSIINAFNEVELDSAVGTDIWQSDDVLGWLYESYNNYKKAEHKESGAKTEYNKVSIQSQVYTPRWVVKFLVDNSLGKMYLEMFPDSEIKRKYKVLNSPKTVARDRKPLTEIRLIDPSTGSGNFLLYAFDVFYDLYIDQIDNYGASYDTRKIPELIIQNNLHGIDLDDRAIQLAQLGLFIKAKRKKNTAKIEQFNLVSSDFYLPPYEEVRGIFEANNDFDSKQREVIRDIWEDLQNAYKFGALIRLEEKLNFHFHGLIQSFQATQIAMFTEETLANFEQFRSTFFINLKKAVEANSASQGITFLNTKTQDAISFLQLLTQKYDVVVANPPYTDSADFGPELKKFIEANYKQPFKFNTNLYAAFIKRCCEVTTDDGYVGMIHPHTFMFIKTFEDVRKYLVDHTHIDLMVDYGLDRVNLFGPGILLDATWYVLSKKKKESAGIYFNITANQQEKTKQGSLTIAYDDAINNRINERVYFLSQEKLKIIESWPFIYWISDGFREKFKERSFQYYADVNSGINTGNNEKYLRFHWEVVDDPLWVNYSKGGPFCKWYGNLWTKIRWEDNGEKIKNENGSALRNRNAFFKEGINFSGKGSKGVSFRYLPPGFICDSGGPPITLNNQWNNLGYLLAALNTNLFFYIVDALNPTVNTQVGDIKRIPFAIPSKELENIISFLSNDNVEIKKELCTYRLIETLFKHSPLTTFNGASLKDRVLAYLSFENAHLARVLVNEAIIDELIFEVYELSLADRAQVDAKMGKAIGSLPIMDFTSANGKSIIEMFIEESQITNNVVIEYLRKLPLTSFSDEKIREVKEGLATLYQSNNSLEEFSARQNVNPINVWYLFKEANVIPPSRALEIALEFLAHSVRTLLLEDNDGIIPLVGLPGENALSQRLEQHCLESGFTAAQFVQIDTLVGRPLNEYLEHHFFKDLSNHLNLFMYLPKTPFVWHLSTGRHQGFEAYVIIYKWNKDSLFKLKSHYISKRKESLEFREIQLQGSDTAHAQNEKELIRNQLNEIEEFTNKIEALIDEGYDPILNNGVGKNIAPLQNKGMVKTEVLKINQLEKYLNADW